MDFSNKYIKPILYILIFVFTTFLVYKMFPNKNNFSRSYALGKPWQYELLTAPFDFPIYKSQAEIKKEQDSIKRYFTPYYVISRSVGDRYIKAFLSRTTIDDDSKYHIQRGLHNVYKSGVISEKDYMALNADKIEFVNLSDSSNIWKKSEVSKLYTPTKALEYIADNYPITLNRLNNLNIKHYIRPNLTKDEKKSELYLEELLTKIPVSEGMVQAGEKIIAKGEVIKGMQLKILDSLNREYNEQMPNTDKNLVSIVNIFMIAIFLSLFIIYISLFRREFIRLKNAVFIVLMIFIISSCSSFILHHDPELINIMPFALMAILTRIFFDSRTALFIHNIMVLIVSLFVPSPHVFILLHIPAGIIAISSLKQLMHRSQLVKSAIFIFITYTLIYSGMVVLQTGSFDVDYSQYLIFAINSLLILFAYILIYIFEKLFGYLSDVTLVELSNINNKLLMDFSTKAPGTFQHVIQVSTLAAAIAEKINANPLLARTGALYHDIGKMNNPMCFIENQVSGFNPLNDMTYCEAAKVILAHVPDGVKIAEHNGLPIQIVNFIKSHHGKSVTRYFYGMAKKENPNQDINIEDFAYDGRLPQTKEEAIVMMADAVEAASRSLKEYNETTISDLVENIINAQISEQAFKEAPLTFRNVEEAKGVLKEKLVNIYHSRIEYPE